MSKNLVYISDEKALRNRKKIEKLTLKLAEKMRADPVVKLVKAKRRSKS